MPSTMTQDETLAAIYEESMAQDVDPNLAMAVARQESGFNHSAVSPKGARGLFQLMPSTASDLGVDSRDSAQNIKGGVAYLKQMLGRYHGDTSKALAAYNAGPDTVDRAGGIPNIPETQNYVSSIQRSLGQNWQALTPVSFTPPSLDSYREQAFTPPSLDSYRGLAQPSGDEAKGNTDQSGFWRSLWNQITPGFTGTIVAGALAPVPTAAATFGASNRGAFQTPEQQKEMGDKLKIAHDDAVDAFKKGDYVKAVRIGQDLFLGEGLKEPVDTLENQLGSGNFTGAAGTTVSLLGQMILGHKAARTVMGGGVGGSNTGLLDADPAKDMTQAHGPSSDARYSERIPTAIADIKQHSDGPVTSNEHLATVSPNQRVQNALNENRRVMKLWHDPKQAQGVVADPAELLRATEESLKKMATPEQRAAIMEQERAKIMESPLTPDRMNELLEEKNGELKPFLDKSQDVQAAARQAGAVSGRSQALLDNQAKAIRNTYYRLLDPENDGAGPREVQRRFGGMKMLVDDANANRTRIQGETSGTPLGKVVKTGAALVDAAVSPFKEGGLAEGLLRVPQQYRGVSDPYIARAFRNAPEYTPLPEPPTAENIWDVPRRLLEAGKSPVGVSGVIAPDMAGEIQTNTSRMNTGPRQIEAAKSPVGVSGVIAPNMAGAIQSGTGRLLTGPLQLGAPTNFIDRSGVTIPDIIARASRGSGSSVPLLGAPAAGQPPLNMLNPGELEVQGANPTSWRNTVGDPTGKESELVVPRGEPVINKYGVNRSYPNAELRDGIATKLTQGGKTYQSMTNSQRSVVEKFVRDPHYRLTISDIALLGKM